MPKISRFGRCVLAAGFALAAHTATSAEIVSFSYPPPAVHPVGAASVSAQITLPNTDPGFHGFYLNLVLPQDYQVNGKVWIYVYLTTAVAKPCNALLEPLQLSRFRPGVAPGMFSTGLAPADGSRFVAFPNNNKVMRKVFTIVHDPAFPGGQRSGDALWVGLSRQGGDPSDTCNGDVQVPAIDIRYPRAP